MQIKSRQTTELPQINELGFYEMRFESVGGLGANLECRRLTQAR